MSEWITHDGGPCPVADGVRIDIKTAKYVSENIRADFCVWSHGNDDCDDIIAYRLAKSEPAACEHKWNEAARQGDHLIKVCALCGYQHSWYAPLPSEPLARYMTKRERFAMAAMQGILANPAHDGTTNEWISYASINVADALIAALEAK